MSAMCRNRTHAPQQIGPLFDQRVGAAAEASLHLVHRQTAAPSGLASRGVRSLPEDRLQIWKDLGKIQVALCAHTEVAAGSGIDRDDRLYPGLEIAAHP